MPARKWTKDRVIAAIHERQRQGLSLTSVWREDSPLSQASKSQFGCWRKALVAAGVPGARPHEKWPKERVIAGILARKRAGSRLDHTRREDRKLYGAAERRFGTWQQALVAAGVKERYVPLRVWTREKIIEAIRTRHRNGLTLIGVERHDTPLYSAAQRHFGGWRKAVTVAGIEYPRRTWTSQSVIEAIQSRDRSGLPLRNVGKYDSGLATAAYKYFGSWHQAVLAAGIEYQPRRKWTRERLIQEIRTWYPDGQLKADVWTEDKGLAAAALNYFGSWHNALKAAGIEPKRRMWSQERALKELRDWRQGNPQTGLWMADKGLASAALKYFGSINQALHAAGVEPRPRGWNKQALIESIQDRHVRGLTLRDGVEGQDTALVSSAKRHFGSWGAALQAAGITVTWQRRWKKETVVKELRHWHQRGLPLRSIADEYGALYGAVYRYFGSWRAALAAAGLEDAQ